jgi:hypothetical protein
MGKPDVPRLSHDLQLASGRRFGSPSLYPPPPWPRQATWPTGTWLRPRLCPLGQRCGGLVIHVPSMARTSCPSYTSEKLLALYETGSERHGARRRRNLLGQGAAPSTTQVDLAALLRGDR